MLKRLLIGVAALAALATASPAGAHGAATGGGAGAVPVPVPVPVPMIHDAAHDAAIDRAFAAARTELESAAHAALGSAWRPMPADTLPQRKSVTALTPAEVASLRRGIAQMIAWNTAPHGSAEFKRSLVYWANIHSYIGKPCSNPAAIAYPGMSGLTTQTATTDDEKATWCTCQHGTDQFLTWHRMYLYYFEQVLQAASGDPNLRLPFWDYETDGAIPDVYRAPQYNDGAGHMLPNPLYVANRQAQLNAGTAKLDPAVTSTSGAMIETDYLRFDNALEGTPHGAVHCAVGVKSCPSGYMGYVPTAGNDPIFYAHHTNIDRLYECWLAVDQAARLPQDPKQLAQQFSFIDGAGTLVTRAVGDMLTTQQLGYRYTAGGGCPSASEATVQREQAQLKGQAPAPRVFALAGATRLKRGTTLVPLQITPAQNKALTAANAAASGVRPQLVIDGLAYDTLPGVLYKVYLQDKAGKRRLLGVINFFNATAPHDHAGHDGAMPDTYSFDARAAIAALGGAGTLVIEPSSGVTGTTAAQAAEQVNPAANVRFRSARIELR